MQRIKNVVGDSAELKEVEKIKRTAEEDKLLNYEDT